MNTIFILIDYKGIFGSKYIAVPYRSGMNKELLVKYFRKCNFDVRFLEFSAINLRSMNFKDKYVIYTSSEDIGGHYKDYIEDVLLGLELQGAKLIPEFKYFRAHNNKVFMEILRDLSTLDEIKSIQSKHFGTIVALKKMINEKSVLKSARGAVSMGVYLSQSKKDLIRKAKKISRSTHIKDYLWDLGRSIKRRGYIRESIYKQKFIVQNYIPNLLNDWKILIFGKKYYILYRKTRKNDFRASGSGLLEYREKIPEGILDYAVRIYNCFNLPHLSIDVAYNEKNFYLIEFQAIYFGSHTLDTSPFYFTKDNNKWNIHHKTSILEEEYVNSIIYYLNKSKEDIKE